jgi:hypothetical protein
MLLRLGSYGIALKFRNGRQRHLCDDMVRIPIAEDEPCARTLLAEEAQQIRPCCRKSAMLSIARAPRRQRGPLERRGFSSSRRTPRRGRCFDGVRIRSSVGHAACSLMTRVSAFALRIVLRDHGRWHCTTTGASRASTEACPASIAPLSKPPPAFAEARHRRLKQGSRIRGAAVPLAACAS